MTLLLIMTLALVGPPPTTLAIDGSPATGVDGGARGAAPSAVRIELDYDQLLGPEPAYVAERTAFYIRDGATKRLRDEHEVSVVEEASAPRILVTLRWANHEDSIYGVTMKTQREGEAPRELEQFECECVDSSLTDAVLTRMPAALRQLAEEAPVAASEAAAPGEPVDGGTEPGPEGPPGRSPKAAVIGPVGVVGVVVAAGGLGMVGLGAARLAKGQTEQLSADEQRVTQRDHRPSGRAWLGAGLGTAAVGITMLAIDLTVLRKKRRARALTWAPWMGPRDAGLSVQGRF